jgi:hypothetical protein
MPYRAQKVGCKVGCEGSTWLARVRSRTYIVSGRNTICITRPVAMKIRDIHWDHRQPRLLLLMTAPPMIPPAKGETTIASVDVPTFLPFSCRKNWCSCQRCIGIRSVGGGPYDITNTRRAQRPKCRPAQTLNHSSDHAGSIAGGTCHHYRADDRYQIGKE